jgi:hypothetical protein
MVLAAAVEIYKISVEIINNLDRYGASSPKKYLPSAKKGFAVQMMLRK